MQLVVIQRFTLWREKQLIKILTGQEVPLGGIPPSWVFFAKTRVPPPLSIARFIWASR